MLQFTLDVDYYDDYVQDNYSEKGSEVHKYFEELEKKKLEKMLMEKAKLRKFTFKSCLLYKNNNIDKFNCSIYTCDSNYLIKLQSGR